MVAVVVDATVEEEGEAAVAAGGGGGRRAPLIVRHVLQRDTCPARAGAGHR
jgi:hypothetical protein